MMHVCGAMTVVKQPEPLNFDEEIRQAILEAAKPVPDEYEWRGVRFFGNGADTKYVFRLFDWILKTRETCLDLTEFGRNVLRLEPKLASIVEKGTGASLVHVAARLGLVNIIKILQGAGMDCAAPDLYGNTALHEAVEHGQDFVVCYFLKNKLINPNVKNKSGNTPMHEACFYLRVQAFEMLLYCGADLDAENDFKQLPLHHLMISPASRGFKITTNYTPDELGIIAILKVCEQYKKTLRMGHVDSWGGSPLTCALSNGFVDVIKFLQQCGVHVPNAVACAEQQLMRNQAVWKETREGNKRPE